MNILTRESALNILRAKKAYFAQKYGITALGIFGSLARNQSTEASDADIVVKMEKPDLFFMVHVKEDLENAYQKKVDIVRYREHMNAFLKQRIDAEAVYV